VPAAEAKKAGSASEATLRMPYYYYYYSACVYCNIQAGLNMKQNECFNMLSSYLRMTKASFVPAESKLSLALHTG